MRAPIAVTLAFLLAGAACDSSTSAAPATCDNFDGGTLMPGVAAGGIDTGPPDAVVPDGGAPDGGGAGGVGGAGGTAGASGAGGSQGGAGGASGSGGAAGSDGAGGSGGAPSNIPTGHWVWQSSNEITCKDDGLQVTLSGTGALGNLFGFIKIAPDGTVTFGTAGLPNKSMTVTGTGGSLLGTSPAWTGLSVDAILTSDDGTAVMHAKGELAVACP